MRYLKLFESFEDIDDICRRYYIKNYTINTDGSIDVDEYVNFDGYIDVNKVNLYNLRLKKLPLKFNKINCDFYCNSNKLTSLEGSPVEVNGCFYCNSNKLTSFEFAPKIIREYFCCDVNYITSFEYFPSYVKKLYCSNNPILDVWVLFEDLSKIELLNDFDIFRDEDTNYPAIIMDRLNDFLLTIGKSTVKSIGYYKNI